MYHCFFFHRVDMEMMMNKLIPEVCLLLIISICMYMYHLLPMTVYKIKWIMFYKQNVLSNIKGFLYNVHKVHFD